MREPFAHVLAAPVPCQARIWAARTSRVLCCYTSNAPLPSVFSLLGYLLLDEGRLSENFTMATLNTPGGINTDYQQDSPVWAW